MIARLTTNVSYERSHENTCVCKEWTKRRGAKTRLNLLERDTDRKPIVSDPCAMPDWANAVQDTAAGWRFRRRFAERYLSAMDRLEHAELQQNSRGFICIRYTSKCRVAAEVWRLSCSTGWTKMMLWRTEDIDYLANWTKTDRVTQYSLDENAVVQLSCERITTLEIQSRAIWRIEGRNSCIATITTYLPRSSK